MLSYRVRAVFSLSYACLVGFKYQKFTSYIQASEVTYQQGVMMMKRSPAVLYVAYGTTIYVTSAKKFYLLKSDALSIPCCYRK